MANNSWTLPTSIGSMVTHCQLPPYEYHWATRQARDFDISANSLGTWFFSKKKLRNSTQRLLEIIPYRTRWRGGGCLPVTSNVHTTTFSMLQRRQILKIFQIVHRITCVRAEPRKGRQATTRPIETKSNYFDALFSFHGKYFLPWPPDEEI